MGTRAGRAAMSVVAMLVLTTCAGGSSSARVNRAVAADPLAAPASVASVHVGATVFTSVSVATLWSSPSAPRPVDAPALANPVHIGTWLSRMSVTQRLALVGRVETQTLLGDPLVVTQVREHWLRVVAPRQPTRRDDRGYPGWVPRRQVTTAKPVATASLATVVRRLADLRRPDGALALRASFGTRLPVLRVGVRRTTVATPTGGALTVLNSAVVHHARNAAALALTRPSVLASARSFLGAPYIWGGRSGFAVDCSGFTSLVYAAHGRRIPRDADDQALAGRRVAIGRQQPADLLFFDRGGVLGHVAFYGGSGRMLQAPRTGAVVSTAPVSSAGALVAVRSLT